jgi:HK97 family phage major capsid protein
MLDHVSAAALRRAKSALDLIGDAPKREPTTDGLERLYEDARSGRTSRHLIEYRDLTAAVAGAGGFLAGGQTLDPLNPLPPESVARQAGVRALMLPVPSEAPTLPIWETAPTFEWLPTEATQLTNQTPALRAVATTLKHGGAFVTISHNLNRQSNAVENLQSLLRQVAAVGIDNGFFAGSGAAGAPTGLANTAGLATVSGSTLGWTGVTDLEEAVALKDAADARLAFVAHPGVRKLLRRREKITGGGVPVWNGNEIAGHPAYVSTSVPSATLFAGDFSNSTIVLWGPVTVLVNPYSATGFKAGKIELAVFVAMDVIVHYPAAFGLSTSIT